MLDARHDFEDVSKLTKAEMARFDKEKVDDFKKALEEYTDSLALRQREVSLFFPPFLLSLSALGPTESKISTLTSRNNFSGRRWLATLSRSTRQDGRS
jgi:sorting nexin-1/2